MILSYEMLSCRSKVRLFAPFQLAVQLIPRLSFDERSLLSSDYPKCKFAFLCDFELCVDT